MSVNFTVAHEDTDITGYRVAHADAEINGTYSSTVFTDPDDATGLLLEHNLRCTRELCEGYGGELVAVLTQVFPEVSMHVRHHLAVARLLGLDPTAMGEGMAHDPDLLLDRIAVAQLLGERSEDVAPIALDEQWVEGGSRAGAVENLLTQIETVARAAQRAGRVVISA